MCCAEAAHVVVLCFLHLIPFQVTKWCVGHIFSMVCCAYYILRSCVQLHAPFCVQGTEVVFWTLFGMCETKCCVCSVALWCCSRFFLGSFHIPWMNL